MYVYIVYNACSVWNAFSSRTHTLSRRRRQPVPAGRDRRTVVGTAAAATSGYCRGAYMRSAFLSAFPPVPSAPETIILYRPRYCKVICRNNIAVEPVRGHNNIYHNIIVCTSSGSRGRQDDAVTDVEVENVRR